MPGFGTSGRRQCLRLGRPGEHRQGQAEELPRTRAEDLERLPSVRASCEVCPHEAVLALWAAALKLAAELNVFWFLPLAVLPLASETWHKLLPVSATLLACFLPG